MNLTDIKSKIKVLRFISRDLSSDAQVYNYTINNNDSAKTPFPGENMIPIELIELTIQYRFNPIDWALFVHNLAIYISCHNKG